MSLPDVMAAAQTWGVDLIARYSDAKARDALHQTSKALQQSVLQAATQATVTLPAHGGTRTAALRRRLARAEQGLAARGLVQQEGSSTKLVVQQPTPNPDALQALLTMSAAAGAAVTDLEIDHGGSSERLYTGVRTAWLGSMTQTFTSLRVLHIGRLCGCLPQPSELPGLRDLYVQLIDTDDHHAWPYESIEAICTSVSRYLPQITTLRVDGSPRPDDFLHAYWPELLSTHTHTLTRFTTNGLIDEGFAKQAREYLPELEYVGCGGVVMAWGEEDMGEWPVRELSCERAVMLAELPRVPKGLTLLANDEGCIGCCFDVKSEEVSTHTDTHKHRYRSPTVSDVW